MATYQPAKRATAWVGYISLVSQADTKLMKSNPTIAAGDFKVSKDGGALANLTTLPSVTPASSVMVKIDLSATEMTADNVTVVCSDAAGAEWCDLVFNLQPSARQIDDLAYPAASGRSMAVDASGVVKAEPGYMLGAVWIGPTANTNTVSYIDGIATNPVSTVAAAKTVADALSLRKFHVVRTATAQIGANMVGYDFDGTQWSLTTTGGSRDVSSSSFANALVTGGTYASTSASSYWRDCEFATGVSVAAVNMQGCTFQGTLTFTAAGNYDFIDCASVVAGTSAPVFDMGAAVGATNVSFRRWSGGMTINNIASGDVISIDCVSGGTITLNGADGNVQVRGMCNIVDNRTGTPTLGTTNNMDTRLDTLDAAVAAVQSDTNDIQTRIPAALTAGGNMKADVLAISGSTAAADNLEESTEAIAYGTIGTGSTTTSLVASSFTPASAVNDQFNGRTLIFKNDTTTAALRGQATTISDYDHASLTLTVAALTSSAVSGDTFAIL